MKRSGFLLLALALVASLAVAPSSEAVVINYSVAQLQGLTVDAPTPNLIAADLIAGNQLDVMTGVGEQLNPANDTFAFTNTMTRRDAASGIDGHWIQTDNDEIWDLGVASDRVVVGNPFDHDRFNPNLAVRYLESLEYTVWGNNDPNAAFGGHNAPGDWERAEIARIYAQGYDPVAVWDDFTAELFFPSELAYRYVHVIAQSSINIDGAVSADNEIDFVARIGEEEVPEPATLTLLGLGLVGLLRRRRG